MCSSLFNESFFSFGFKTVSLSFPGIQPDCNDLLTIVAIKSRSRAETKALMGGGGCIFIYSRSA